MRTIEPTDQHRAFRKSMEQCIAEHGATLDAAEILALLAQLVGQVIALQDQRKVTPEMAMQCVIKNMQQGNEQAMQSLLSANTGMPQ
jgi:hypothetical protein